MYKHRSDDLECDPIELGGEDAHSKVVRMLIQVVHCHPLTDSYNPWRIESQTR
jgi:hypothetical protein